MRHEGRVRRGVFTTETQRAQRGREGDLFNGRGEERNLPLSHGDTEGERGGINIQQRRTTEGAERDGEGDYVSGEEGLSGIEGEEKKPRSRGGTAGDVILERRGGVGGGMWWLGGISRNCP